MADRRLRVFICGSAGQLGRDCAACLGERHEVRGADLPEIDITRPESVAAALDPFGPAVVVNCAAYTLVDQAETEREKARAVNAVGPGVLAEYAARRGAELIHISTDYVFDGRRLPPEPYVETDPVGPLSHYGLTKLDGERAVQAHAPRHKILRTAWLYGRHGRNFLKTMLRLALQRKGQTLRVVNDQFGCPTWSFRLAQQVVAVTGHGEPGIYHATGQGYCSWYEFARTFLEAMGVDHTIEPCLAAEYRTAAVRPLNSILDNAALRRQGLLVMRHWREDLLEYVARYRDELLAEAAG